MMTPALLSPEGGLKCKCEVEPVLAPMACAGRLRWASGMRSPTGGRRRSSMPRVVFYR